MVAAAPPNAGDGISGKISAQVKSKMLENEKVPVIITLKNQIPVGGSSKENAVVLLKNHAFNTQRNLISLLREEETRGRADNIEQLWIVNAIAVNASPAVIEKLSKDDDVANVDLDSMFHIVADYSVSVSEGQIANATSEIKRINATKVWEYGIDGTGINVAVIDTGINASHPDVAGRVIDWVDYVRIPPGDSAYDDYWHGTHVAGTVGGNGTGGTTTGVAPNVNLLIAKACNSYGDCTGLDIIKSVQWSANRNSDIISMSLGGPRDLNIKRAIDNAVDMGIVVIAAAGNSGPGAGTIQFPAGEKNVIAVGNIDSSDNIYHSSSRGPITVDGETLTKPDVSAPGVNIYSLSHTSSGYVYGTGTSMATPHVSGTVALLLQAAKKKNIILSPDQIKNILEATSVDRGAPGKDNYYGSGRIDVFNATYNYILSMINGTIKDNATMAGIPGAIVTTNTSVSTSTDASGSYSLPVLPGTYSLTAKDEPLFYPNNSIIITVEVGPAIMQDIELLKKPTGNITGLVTETS